MSNRGAASNAAKARKVRASDEASKDAGSARPDFRLIALMALAGSLVSILAILVLSEQPDVIASADATRPGGESVVKKSASPTAALRPAVPDTAKSETVAEARPAVPPEPTPSIDAQPGAGQGPATIAVTAPVPPLPVQAVTPLPVQQDIPVQVRPQSVQPQIPVAVLAPADSQPANTSPSIDASSQAARATPPADPAPLPDRRPAAAPLSDRAPTAAAQPAAAPGERINLPWQNASGAASAPAPAAAARSAISAPLPSRAELGRWVKSEAREFVGGVDAEGMPLYRFEVWLEPPAAVRRRIRKVSYAYAAPSAQPSQQSSSDAASGFKVRFGAAACAERATVTLTLDDGQEQRVDVDGCKILN